MGSGGFRNMEPPSEVLAADTTAPISLTRFELPGGAFSTRVADVKRDIRKSLFRQAISKVQNVEVMYMGECKENRILKSVDTVGRPWDLNFLRSRDNQLLREEIWRVDRCGNERKYRVRYYTEGGDGFSSKVFPTSIRDCINAVCYYLSD